MMKHLFWYPWILAALALGLAFCLAMLAHQLFFQPQPPEIRTEAQFVMEVICHASV